MTSHSPISPESPINVDAPITDLPSWQNFVPSNEFTDAELQNAMGCRPKIELNECRQDKKICNVMEKIGLTNASKITKTLQGSIWRANDRNNKTVCVKVADQQLYKDSRAVIEGKSYDVLEDICLEQSIVKYVTQTKQCPNSITKYIKFIKSRTNFFFIMEDGGNSLFDFVQRVHQYIADQFLDIEHWKKAVRVILHQMVEAIAYIHSLNICHFDISLENWLINDVSVDILENGQMLFDLSDIRVKVCDFGLAKKFTSDACMSTKYCGKEQYSSPEVIDGCGSFDAKANDIHCLGVCAFMLVTGGPPWARAHLSDDNYVFTKQKSIARMLKLWKIGHYAEPYMIHLFNSVFRTEKMGRANIGEIQQFIAKYH